MIAAPHPLQTGPCSLTSPIASPSPPPSLQPEHLHFQPYTSLVHSGKPKPYSEMDLLAKSKNHHRVPGQQEVRKGLTPQPKELTRDSFQEYEVHLARKIVIDAYVDVPWLLGLAPSSFYTSSSQTFWSQTFWSQCKIPLYTLKN